METFTFTAHSGILHLGTSLSILSTCKHKTMLNKTLNTFVCATLLAIVLRVWLLGALPCLFWRLISCCESLRHFSLLMFCPSETKSWLDVVISLANIILLIYWIFLFLSLKALLEYERVYFPPTLYPHSLCLQVSSFHYISTALS